MPAIHDLDVLTRQPSQCRQPPAKCRSLSLGLRVAFRPTHQHADPLHAVSLLRASLKRPSRRAAEQRDELAPAAHSITSSARASSRAEISRPRPLPLFSLLFSS